MGASQESSKEVGQMAEYGGMDVRDVIVTLMGEQHVTLRALGSRMGGISGSSVHQAVKSRQRSMSVDRAVDFLGCLGYEIVAVPVGSKVPSGSYVLGKSTHGE